MAKKGKGEFEVTVQKTKYLNDTAVEYINGIEVIKAFGKTGSSYEKFVNATRLTKTIERKTKADIGAETAAIPAVGFQNLICKLMGVCIAGASLAFYLNGTMELTYAITMLMYSFMVFESLDAAGTYTALLKVIGKGVDRVNEILEIEQMDINGEDIKPPDLYQRSLFSDYSEVLL